MAKKKFVQEIMLSNYKKHENYNEKVNGKHFVLSGPNGIGKSSILEAINRLIGRQAPTVKGVAAVDNTPQEPITKGKDSGSIATILVADGTEYRVEEKYTKSGKARFKFYRLGNGTKDELNPPQERLKQIFGNVTDFSPLMDLSGTKQFEFLQQAFEMDVSGYTLKRKGLVEDRKIAKDEVKRLEARLANPEFRVLGDSDIEKYAQEKSVQDVIAKKKDVLQIQNNLNTAKRSNENRRTIREAIKKNEEQIDDLKRQILWLEGKNELLQQQLEKNVVPDIDGITKELEEAQAFNREVDKELAEIGEFNRKVLLVKTWLSSKQELEQARETAKEEDAKIKDLDKSLRSSMTKVPFTEIYEGLELKYELDDNNSVKQIGLFLRDLPFHRLQQSTGEMIKVIIKLSTFINPNGLNFVSIGDWNMLDSKNKQEILDYAKENENVQLGIEKVDDTTEIVTEFIELD